jgi:hypothetical protein
MKAIKFIRAALILLGILLSACAAPSNSAPANGGGKGLSDIAFSGVIESMEGDQWVINGQTIKVDSSILRDGPFVVGDTVKVEASVAQDGSVTAQRVESPSAVVLMSTNTPEVPSATQLPVFNDNGNEAVGTVEAITDTSITIGGQTYTFAQGAEIKDEIAAGDVVKVHFTVSSDGTLSIREIEIADPTQVGNDNTNDDNSNGTNVNDDNSNDDNSNDSNSNDDNGNDDHGGNDDNSNDDHGGNDNG